MSAVPYGKDMATCVYSAQGNMMCGANSGMHDRSDPIINTQFRRKSNTCSTTQESQEYFHNEQGSFMGSLGKLVDASASRLRKEGYAQQAPHSKPGPSAFDVASDFTGTWAPWTPI
jgi:hypothetical protein